jgi:hypothetical protein
MARRARAAFVRRSNANRDECLKSRRSGRGCQALYIGMLNNVNGATAAASRILCARILFDADEFR